MRETRKRWRIIPTAERLRVGTVGNVENEHAAVDIAEIAAVGALRIDVGVVGAEAHVVARSLMPRRRRDRVTHARSGHPPAAHLHRLYWVLDVEGAIKLVVERVGGGEVWRPRCHVNGLPVAEPQLMYPA